MYRVDRIENLDVSDKPEAFEKPRGFDMRSTFSSQPWEAGRDPEVVVKMRFDAEVAWWAARSLDLEHSEGDLETEIKVVNRDAFTGWVLSFGTGAEVLEPPEIRELVRDRVAVVVGAVE